MAAIKLSKISSKCLYCLGVSVEIFSIRREESVSVMMPRNKYSVLMLSASQTLRIVSGRIAFCPSSAVEMVCGVT